MFESAESADDDEYSGVYLYQAALVGCEKTGVIIDTPCNCDVVYITHVVLYL